MSKARTINIEGKPVRLRFSPNSISAHTAGPPPRFLRMSNLHPIIPGSRRYARGAWSVVEIQGEWKRAEIAAIEEANHTARAHR